MVSISNSVSNRKEAVVVVVGTGPAPTGLHVPEKVFFCKPEDVQLKLSLFAMLRNMNDGPGSVGGAAAPESDPGSISYFRNHFSSSHD